MKLCLKKKEKEKNNYFNQGNVASPTVKGQNTDCRKLLSILPLNSVTNEQPQDEGASKLMEPMTFKSTAPSLLPFTHYNV